MIILRTLSRVASNIREDWQVVLCERGSLTSRLGLCPKMKNPQFYWGVTFFHAKKGVEMDGRENLIPLRDRTPEEKKDRINDSGSDVPYKINGGGNCFIFCLLTEKVDR